MDENNFADRYFAHIPTHETKAEKPEKDFYTLPQLKPIEIFNPDKDRTYFIKEYGPAAGYLLFLEAELKRNGIEPVYETTTENRKHLHTEPGVIYANHPTKFDTHLILGALKDGARNVRTDFTVLIDDQGRSSAQNMTEYEELVSDFGEKHFLPARPENATRIFKDARKRIEAGGVFIIFPSFKSERKTDTRVLRFQNGLAYLLPQLPPSSMVYSFGINKNDALTARERGGQVAISEDYSKAKDWTDIFQEYGAEDRDTQSSLLALHTKLTHERNLAGYEVVEEPEGVFK